MLLGKRGGSRKDEWGFDNDKSDIVAKFKRAQQRHMERERQLLRHGLQVNMGDDERFIAGGRESFPQETSRRDGSSQAGSVKSSSVSNIRSTGSERSSFLVRMASALGKMIPMKRRVVY